jgi:phage major head subunit gpT-like protein
MAPRPITASLLTDVFTGFKTSFRGGFAGVTPAWSAIATQVPSTARVEKYSWLGNWPKIREWIGDRHVKQLSAHEYSLSNKPFESTIEVDRDDIEDDAIGIYAPMFTELGATTAAFPDELITPLLPNGTVAKCYDGQPFFDTDHPVGAGVMSNNLGGGGTAWYLLSTTRSLKPLIYQTRRPFDLTAMDNPTDTNVFNRRKYIYGVDGRANAGYGFWQMAVRSAAALDADGFEAARNKMASFTDDEGKPLGLMGNLVVAPQTLEGAGRRLLKSSTKANGATNEWEGAADLLILPLL